ncbi:LAMI_0F07888g1_1 [Lachancea mirantina]|uniref:methylated diphthine methylhydrolase n=1 Tax=Lachancea mirantina TaxID=1230905 RepID=A0A1G4K021_9SACH|nr:LAMI_0F07888g1_1 [Lachancea mirantina]
MEVPGINSCAKITTSHPPCCLRIFRDNFLLVGTYDLNKSTGHRTGSIDVYDRELTSIGSYSTYGAILDLKLSPHLDTLVATGHSTGNLTLWRILVTADGIELEEICNIQIFDPDVLVSSLHFSPNNCESILVTGTSGESKVVNVLREGVTFSLNAVTDHYDSVDSSTYKVQGKDTFAVEDTTPALTSGHSLECWTGEFGYLHPLQNVVFTGGDDSVLQAHDLRTANVIWSNGRIHGAGVVAIKSSTETFRANKPTSILTGSYDDNMRDLDLRMLGDEIYPGVNVPPAGKREKCLGGGVWRFAESPRNLIDPSANELLVCCMYNGAKVVRVYDDEIQEIRNMKKGHESMCYGGDWGKRFAATCSFYDCSLQLWDI